MMDEWTEWLTAAGLAEELGFSRASIDAWIGKDDGLPHKGYLFQRREATAEDIRRLGCAPQTRWVARASKVADAKRCRRCGLLRTIDNFATSSTAKDGYASVCQGCDGRRLGRTSVMSASKAKGCHECGGVLTRNRTTKLDGRLLCHPCWQQVFA